MLIMAPGLTTNGRKQPSFAVSTGRPPTSTRLPAVDADESITKPGVARANAAVSSAKPDGDRAYTAENQNSVRFLNIFGNRAKNDVCEAVFQATC